MLHEFAKSRGITFPLLADQGSTIIRQYGLLNESVNRQDRTYGIPHPGTFIVNRRGRVTARFFEQAYQERFTAGNILARQGTSLSGVTTDLSTPHLDATVALSDRLVAPGERVSLGLDVVPKPGMHLYAPGKHRYRVIRMVLDPQPWLRVHEAEYPPSTIYHFKPLDERIEVYQRPFRLLNDLTILATPEARKLLAGQTKLEITARLEYQACDDRVCYTPQTIPLRLTVDLRPLERK